MMQLLENIVAVLFELCVIRLFCVVKNMNNAWDHCVLSYVHPGSDQTVGQNWWLGNHELDG